MAIYYFCPDIRSKSAGIRLLYRHVALLNANEIPAFVMHLQDGFVLEDVAKVPLVYLSTVQRLAPGDVLVIPETCFRVMELFRNAPTIRRMAMVLNWDYAFCVKSEPMSYKAVGIERVLTMSPEIGDLMLWAFGLPINVFHWGIDSSLYYPTELKQPQIVYIDRKQDRALALQCILFARDPRYINQIAWTALDDLSEEIYAAAIRKAAIFLNLSRAEGLPCSMLEAMHCRTLVGGYTSIGGRQELIGDGPTQNAILVETMDYPALARKLEPILHGLLKDESSAYAQILDNAQQTSAAYTREAEEASVLAMWRELL